MRRAILCVVTVFFTWAVFDLIIGMVFLSAEMQANPDLWRPFPEMKMGLLYLVTLISAAVFVSLYAMFVSDKSLMTALKFSLVFGLGAGISSGYGSYASMPIPYSLALTFFLSTTARFLLGGLIVGLGVRQQ